MTRRAAHAPRAREDLTVVTLDGEAVVYDARSGLVHHLNPTASLVFRFCTGGASVGELASDIAGAFGLPAPDVEREIDALVDRFRDAGLLEPPEGGR